MATKKNTGGNKGRKKSSSGAQNMKCARLLKQLVPLLVPEDRKEAMAKHSISYVTISRYLQGDVANLALGLSLLNFFTGRINKRKAELNGFNFKKDDDA